MGWQGIYSWWPSAGGNGGASEIERAERELLVPCLCSFIYIYPSFKTNFCQPPHESHQFELIHIIESWNLPRYLKFWKQMYPSSVPCTSCGKCYWHIIHIFFKLSSLISHVLVPLGTLIGDNKSKVSWIFQLPHQLIVPVTFRAKGPFLVMEEY